MVSSPNFIAGIDAGGTTFKCAIGDCDGNLLEKLRVPVTEPKETLTRCADFFRSTTRGKPLHAMGIASFGPIDVDPSSKTYGTILKTPKPGWENTNLRLFFIDALGLQANIDTDVNGALLAEKRKGNAQSANNAAYITIGTGIGAGIFVNGAVVGRPTHPEFGHIPLRRHPDDIDFESTCPFHGDCLEGLASVTAMRARWGEPKQLRADHYGWFLMADYLAQACRILSLTLRLDKIILGGGMMLAPHLLQLVRSAYDAQMAGYLGDRAKSGRDLIDRPGLGDDAGLTGAILLATRTG